MSTNPTHPNAREAVGKAMCRRRKRTGHEGGVRRARPPPSSANQWGQTPLIRRGPWRVVGRPRVHAGFAGARTCLKLGRGDPVPYVGKLEPCLRSGHGREPLRGAVKQMQGVARQSRTGLAMPPAPCAIVVRPRVRDGGNHIVISPRINDDTPESAPVRINGGAPGDWRGEPLSRANPMRVSGSSPLERHAGGACWRRDPCSTGSSTPHLPPDSSTPAMSVLAKSSPL